VITTEVYHPRSDYDDGETVTQYLRRERPEAKIILYSVYKETDDIVFKYKTVFGIDAYMEKTKHGLEDVVRKTFELLEVPYPFSN